MVACNCNLRNLREVYFYKGDKKVTPREIFNVFYTPLDNLIEQNRSIKEVRFTSFDNFNQEYVDQRLIDETKKKIENLSEGWGAVAIFDSGAKRKFSIKPRTNYHNSLVKRPSIVFLEPENGTYSSLVLREARNYDLNGWMAKRIKKAYGRHFKHGFYESIKQGNKLSLNDLDIVMIPEAPLVLGLEQLASVRDNIRITPEIRIAGFDENHMWYLRNFLPSLMDASFNPDEFAKYIGKLHGLGLIDTFDLSDTSIAQYCKSGKIHVNIDPDFFVYTTNDKMISHYGLTDLREQIINKFYKIHSMSFKNFKTLRRSEMKRVSQLLKDSTILDYIPQDISKAPALTLKNLTLDNI